MDVDRCNERLNFLNFLSIHLCKYHTNAAVGVSSVSRKSRIELCFQAMSTPTVSVMISVVFVANRLFPDSASSVDVIYRRSEGR